MNLIQEHSTDLKYYKLNSKKDSKEKQLLKNANENMSTAVYEAKESWTLFDYALDVLQTHDADVKAAKTLEYVAQWENNQIPLYNGEVPSEPSKLLPEKPCRPLNVETVPAHKIKSGSRKALVHSVVHAENYAIDLMWDIVSRFMHWNLPRDFYNDWIRIAGEEAHHYLSWAKRLKELGSFYGELPGHDGLWDSAQDTKDNLLARLAIVHMVHEARGLDVFLNAVARFKKAQDDRSLEVIHKNHLEEITHVGAGVKWFKYLCKRDGNEENTIQTFIDLVPKYFHGMLKPPFNVNARSKAGLTEEWYLPLSSEI